MRLTDRQYSRLHLLRAIRRAEPVSRTELARLTGYSTQTVSDLVAELRARRLVFETQACAAGRGRPRMMLHINPDGATVAGAFLYPDHRLGIELADLTGNSILSEVKALPAAPTMEAMVPLIATAIRETLATSQLPVARIRAVGLGVTGTVDSHRGNLHYIPRYAGPTIPLADMLAQELGLPVHLDSAADVLARAEHWYGEDRLVDDFAVLFVGFGLGYAQYADGMLRAGSHGLNPEVAHLKLTYGCGPPCYCGSQGCLGTYASVAGVNFRIAAARGLAAPKLSEMTTALKALAEEARAGARDAIDAFQTAGALLGIAAANLLMLNDPARLLINVQDPVFCEMISDRIRSVFEENLHPAMRGIARLQIRTSNELAFAKGAAALILEDIYSGDNTQN